MWWTLGEHASPCENGDVIGVPLGQREVMDRHDDGLVEVTDECEQVVLLGNNQPHLLAAWPGESAGLSARESELLALITQGLSNEQITAVCYLSINTVKTYIRSTYRKIGVSTRAQAVAWAMRNGFDIQH